MSFFEISSHIRLASRRDGRRNKSPRRSDFLYNRKFIKDINGFYGEYQAGAEVGSRAPLVDYTTEDMEPSEAVERGNG